MADTHGNPSKVIARASRAGVSVTQQGDKMNDTTTQKATTTNAAYQLIQKENMKIRQTFRFIAHYERLLDSGIWFDADGVSERAHAEGRGINLYMMLQDFKDALSGDLEWEDEE